MDVPHAHAAWLKLFFSTAMRAIHPFPLVPPSQETAYATCVQQTLELAPVQLARLQLAVRFGMGL